MTNPTAELAAWFTFVNAGVTYPFVEDENANVTGYGHQDPAEFAAAVNAYDEAMTGEVADEEDQWTADHISHQWAVMDPDGERVRPVNHDQVPESIPITTLWGQR